MVSRACLTGLQHLFILVAFCSVTTGFCIVPAQAHNVTVFAWVEDSTVHVESKFAGGRTPKNAPVEVYDAAGNRLLQGETDENGKFSFTAPQKSDLKIVLQAGMGHRAHWTVSRAEFGGGPAASSADAAASEAAAADTVRTAAAPAETGITKAELQEVLERALDKKLKPLMRLAAESQKSGPSLNEIIGGIGYIFGLVGVAAYVHARRHSGPTE